MMSLFSSITSVFTVLFLSHFCQAVYSSTSRSNVALYWGQGAGQQRLLHFCQQSTVDIIPIGFVHIFPAQGNGFPGTNFGNQCWGPPYVYQGPGLDKTKNQLQSQCPQLTADVPVCQATYGKKIILSLGGASNTYQLTGAAQGIAFADFLWGAFGPQTPAWLSQGLPRPFDGPGNAAVEVDGFDFDIEKPSIDNQAGYIAMIKRLRSLFPNAKKQYLITGAPQCIVTDANMGAMISAVQFDIIFIQYYNTPQCSARSWVAANPNYQSSGVEMSSGFTFNTWAQSLVGTPSANAKLYIGLPGDVSGNFYLTPTELKGLVKAYFCKPNFGGIMIWEATVAENNAAGPYYASVKSILAGYALDPALSCYIAPPKTSSTLALPTSTRRATSSSVAKTSSTMLKTTSTSKKLSSTSSLRISTSSSKLSSRSSSIKSTITTIPKSSSTKLSSTVKPLSSSKVTSTQKSTTSTSLRTTSTRSTTTTANLSPSMVIPPGACGAPYGNSCGAGFCCSQYGYCGTGGSWCGAGCQKAFGMCY